MDPLQMATNDELMTEMARRFPTGVFAGVSVTGGVERAPGVTYLWGHGTLCLGLIQRLKLRADDNMKRDMESEGTEEEWGGADADDQG